MTSPRMWLKLQPWKVRRFKVVLLFHHQLFWIIIDLSLNLVSWHFYQATKDQIFLYAALKEKMEQDLDDISKIAQGLKRKLEALDRAVRTVFS